MLKTQPPEDTVWTSKENTSDVKWTLQRATPLEEAYTLLCHTTKVHELHGLCYHGNATNPCFPHLLPKGSTMWG